MKQGWLLIVLGLAAGIGGCEAHILGLGNVPIPLKTKVQRSELDMVTEPNDRAILQIHDVEQWYNPFVVVNRDNYELILHPDPRTTERLTLTELEEALLKLPRARWPLGRVVAVAENPIRSKGDDERIAKGLKELKKMLESHKVRVDLWPSQ
jgi:hypothetical protein